MIAFDKSPQKIKKILRNAENWSLKIIKAFVFDATKASDVNAGNLRMFYDPNCFGDRQ